MPILAQLQIPGPQGQPGTGNLQPGTPPQAVEDIRDIIPPAPLPDYLQIALIALLASLALCLIVYVTLLFLRARARRLALKAPPPSPSEAARAALEQLRADAPNLSPNEFGLATSNIIKQYFHDRYDDPILFETTQEFALRDSARKTIPQSKRVALAEFFAGCDQLKFAMTPDATDGETAGALFEQAASLINEAPVPEAIIADPHYVTSSRDTSPTS